MPIDKMLLERKGNQIKKVTNICATSPLSEKALQKVEYAFVTEVLKLKLSLDFTNDDTHV